MPRGRPRSLAQRKVRHKARYGTTKVPARRYKNRK